MTIKLKNEFPIIIALVTILIITTTVLPSNVLRIILGWSFFFIFPGYTLAAAISPERKMWNSIEGMAMSFGLSVVVSALIALALNYGPWGVKLYPILLSYTIFILIASAIASYRRHRLIEEKRPTITIRLNFRLHFPSDKILSIILIVAVMGVIGATWYTIATPKEECFTEFYVFDREGKIGNYPENLATGDATAVIVGIVNYEQEVTTYHVDVIIDGEKYSEISPMILEQEEKWEQVMFFKIEGEGINQRVEFLLYKNGELYSRLHLSL